MQFLKLIFNSYSFGDQCLIIQIANHWAKFKNKRLILIPWKFYAVSKIKFESRGNNALFNMSSNYTINNFFVRQIFKIINITKIFLQYLIIVFSRIFLKKKISTKHIAIINTSSLEELLGDLNLKQIRKKKIFNSNFNFKFSKNQTSYCNEYLNKNFNIDINDKYAILHVRESRIIKNTSEQDYLRNANINSFNLGIKKLIEKEFKVIRIGNELSTRNYFEHSKQNYIEYCFSDKKKDILDIFLIKNANLILGTQSGVVECGGMFPNIKILTTNMSPIQIHWSPRKYNDLGIFKNTIINSKSLNSYDQLNFHLSNFTHIFDKPNTKQSFEITDNSSEEILSLVSEGLNENIKISQIKFNKFKNYTVLKRLRFLLNKKIINKDQFNLLYFKSILPEGHIARIN